MSDLPQPGLARRFPPPAHEPRDRLGAPRVPPWTHVTLTEITLSGMLALSWPPPACTWRNFGTAIGPSRGHFHNPPKHVAIALTLPEARLSFSMRLRVAVALSGAKVLRLSTAPTTKRAKFFFKRPSLRVKDLPRCGEPDADLHLGSTGWGCCALVAGKLPRPNWPRRCAGRTASMAGHSTRGLQRAKLVKELLLRNLFVAAPPGVGSPSGGLGLAASRLLELARQAVPFQHQSHGDA